MVLTESSEILGFVNMSSLRQKPLCRFKLVSNWVLLTYSLSCGISVGFREKVFTDQSFDMSSISGNLLVSYHMVRSTGPILRKSTLVSKNLFILIYIWGVFVAVKATNLRSVCIQRNWMLSSVLKNFPLYLASCCTKPFIFAWDMTCVAREIFLSIIGGRCKSSHFNFNLFINLNYFILI